MKLVLAEKPSVAMSLSKVIGANQRGDGYMEGNGYFVSWCVGHLVELSQPEAYDEKYAKWRYDDLPILPEHWQYQVSASTKKQFGILKKLMQRKDVESLICATDAGREGELIFRLVYHQCGCKKPVERLWISSMEDSAIREGFQKLRPGTEYDALYEAALCRERADWIVGINATRLFSCLYGQTLNVGRVMTPTLAMVVMRDAAIRAFKPEPFYSAELKFRDFQAGGERMKAKADAEKLVAECCQAGSAIITKVEQKEKSEKPPALFDLTSLQREANRQLGFTAQQTLDYTQALYEKKLVTYPRTDSRYLTDDMAPLVPELVSVIQQSFQIQADVPAPVNAAQVINSKKVTDRPVIMSELKTKAAHRDIPLPDCLTKCLREAKETSTSDYVVANSEGEPLSYTQFKRLWQYIVTRTVKERSYYRYENGKRVKHTVKPVLGERAAHNGKVVYSLDFEVTPHLLRHTYITNLIHASVDPKTVQYLAGHENSKITMDIYAKAKYNRPDELAGILEDTFTLWDAE